MIITKVMMYDLLQKIQPAHRRYLANEEYISVCGEHGHEARG